MSLHDALRDLFLIDQQVRGLESRLSGASRHVEQQEARIEQLHRQRRELEQELQHTQARANLLEDELNSQEERVNKLRDQMNSAKTNKEYSALLVEVNTLKVEKSKVEEQALEQMADVDQIKGRITEIEQKLEEQEKIKQVADKNLAERQAEVGERLAELKAERAAAASKVPADALQSFERLAENYEGEAMAPVIEEDRRRMEYTCGGCYMQIPVEKVNQLISQNMVVHCTSCNRILYLEPELKEAMGVK